MKISLVTTALEHRLPYLRRLVAQAPWLHSHEWIICGPKGLGPFTKQVGAVFVASDEPMGTCRNLCGEAATGEIIVQIDDDDWQAPNRVSKQVAALELVGPGEMRRDVVGSSWLYWLHAPTRVANRLSYWGSLHCLPGATLAYWRSSWQRHPFVPGMSEDGPFTAYFGSQGTCHDMHDPKLIVYMRHGAHTEAQRDWWQETKSQERRLSAVEIMRRRIEHPNLRIPLVESETPRDLAIAHEQEAATIYVQWLMGADDFATFCDDPAELELGNLERAVNLRLRS